MRSQSPDVVPSQSGRAAVKLEVSPQRSRWMSEQVGDVGFLSVSPKEMQMWSRRSVAWRRARDEALTLLAPTCAVLRGPSS